ncbi:rRNA (guanine-N1)-methyltransferase [Prauserella halophila]|uniref:rRNA (Guanine-N1)-methyltransferase n=1 Tax=Prauserella halophila TaxID=185641 RepID=A0ABN1WBL1_9PSEU|nr:23S rRNA (guanine745-N1)-methyltransferase [Prauserella halophila]
MSALRCSVCSAPLHPDGRSLRCVRRHSFDLAKQGYVNLLRAGVDAGTADTSEMAAARADFLATGRYAPLVDVLARVVEASGEPEFVVDAGAGTGYYLAGVLDRVASAWGLALDVSAPALRRAAKAHPRIGAVVWNLWEPWPVADGVADVVLDVFAPRNTAEFHRVLRPGGLLAVATPGAGHLRELVTELGLLDIAGDKTDRIAESLGDHFEPVDVDTASHTAELDADEVRKLVLMGPNAHHLHRGGLGAKLDALTGATEVTFEFDVSVLRRKE